MSFLCLFIFGAVLTRPQSRLPGRRPREGGRGWTWASRGRLCVEETEITSPPPLPRPPAGWTRQHMSAPPPGGKPTLVCYSGNATPLGRLCSQPRWAIVLALPMWPEPGEAGPADSWLLHRGDPHPQRFVSLFCSIKHLTGALVPRGGAVLAGEEGTS